VMQIARDLAVRWAKLMCSAKRWARKFWSWLRNKK
jgi:hypothetical protein